MLLFGGHCELETGHFLHMSQTQAFLFAPIWRAWEERATLSVLRPSHHTLRSLFYCWIVAPMDKGMIFFPAWHRWRFFSALCGDCLGPQYWCCFQRCLSFVTSISCLRALYIAYANSRASYWIYPNGLFEYFRTLWFINATPHVHFACSSSANTNPFFCFSIELRQFWPHGKLSSNAHGLEGFARKRLLDGVCTRQNTRAMANRTVYTTFPQSARLTTKLQELSFRTRNSCNYRKFQQANPDFCMWATFFKSSKSGVGKIGNTLIY